VSRDDLLLQAEKVINDLGATKSMLEVYYEDEVKKYHHIKHVTIPRNRLVLGWAQHWSSSR